MARWKLRLNSKIAIIIAALVFLGCEQEMVFDNPIDENNNPDYVEPETTLLTDINGLTIDSTVLAIEVSGNENVSYFSYKLNDKNWKDTDVDQNPAVIILDYLDEGSHSLTVKSRYAGGQEDPTPQEASFTIDALQGPGLRIFPLLSEITSTDLTDIVIEVSIIAEDVESLVVISYQINYDNNLLGLDIESIELGEMTSDIDSYMFIKEEVAPGQLEISFSVLSHAGISGTGVLIKLPFTPVNAGSCDIEISNPNFRDIDGEVIIIEAVMDGKVIISN